jgi:peptidoglycan/xylan/chitin deacetylase (PgdA/CDA1 family)
LLTGRRLGQCLLLLLLLCAFAMPAQGYTNLAQQKRLWRKAGDVVWERYPAEKVVALTFDDGPNPTYTQAVVNELDKYGDKGTFFVIGSRVVQYPELVKMVAEHGHELGLHGFAHRNMSVWNESRLNDDLKKAEESLAGLGITTHLFRPPLGEVSATLVTVARQRGYQVIMWSWTQDTRDWTRPAPQKIAAHVLKNVRAGDIILLHDGTGNRRNTLLALGLILEGLHKGGYRVTTVSDLLRLPERPGERDYPRRGP